MTNIEKVRREMRARRDARENATRYDVMTWRECRLLLHQILNEINAKQHDYESKGWTDFADNADRQYEAITHCIALVEKEIERYSKIRSKHSEAHNGDN